MKKWLFWKMRNLVIWLEVNLNEIRVGEVVSVRCFINMVFYEERLKLLIGYKIIV